MSNTTQKFTWDDPNLLDDVAYSEADASSFKQLLEQREGSSEESGASFAPGDLLIGKIVELTKDFVVIDVGLKSEGLVSSSEFSDPNELILGADIEVMLEASEDDQGQIVLSRDRARRQRQWEHIVNNCSEGSIVQGTIIRKVKGGLMVDIGMEAFLPGSQIDNKRIKNLDEYLGKTYDFKILKINIERKNVVVSRREILETERQSKRAEILEKMREGDVIKGVVKNITDFGVFLDLDGIDGLLHVTDMTWKRIRHPSEMVEMGEELQVMILSIDHEKGRVALGLKQKESNPWTEVEARYPPGTMVEGLIVNLVPYGAFIELEPGIEGLIHISEMSWVRNVTDPSEIVKKGDTVKAIVLAVQTDEGKISLGLKQAEKNPWEEAADRYPVGTTVEAEVRSLTNYGAFVELEPGIDGLIHISDLSWTKKISHPSELLQKGNKVKGQILSVDTDSRKITLGIKQLSQNPWESIEKTIPVGTKVQGTVTKVAAFGAFVELDNTGLEALIHVTELSDKAFGSVDEVVTAGARINGTVIKLDPEHKKISISLKGEGESIADDIVVSSDESES